jgi:hypothetical protein
VVRTEDVKSKSQQMGLSWRVVFRAAGGARSKIKREGRNGSNLINRPTFRVGRVCVPVPRRNKRKRDIRPV